MNIKLLRTCGYYGLFLIKQIFDKTKMFFIKHRIIDRNLRDDDTRILSLDTIILFCDLLFGNFKLNPRIVILTSSHADLVEI